MSDIKLTPVERLIIKNQYAILEFLSEAFPDVAKRGNVIYHDPKYYRRAQEILYAGYSSLMYQAGIEVSDESLTYPEQKEVMNILDMYHYLQSSNDELEGDAKLDSKVLDFPGWDGNSTKGEMHYARMLCYEDDSINQPTRFVGAKPDPARNSHSPTTEMYRRMLVKYDEIRDSKRGEWFPLTLEEIKSVLAEQMHPDRRGS